MKRIECIPLSEIARLEIYLNAGRKPIRQIRRERGADYAANLVYFNGDWQPVCPLKSGGAVRFRDGYAYDGFAWDAGADIALVPLPAGGGERANYFACMCAIKDGKPQPKLYYHDDVAGARGRTAFALTSRGELLLYCCQDGADAKTPEGVREELAARGDVVSAVIGDGGGKASLIGPDGGVEGAVDTVQNLLLVYLKKGEAAPADGAQAQGEQAQLDDAVDRLAAAGIVDSPERWKALDFTENSVRLLLIKTAAALAPGDGPQGDSGDGPQGDSGEDPEKNRTPRD